MFFLLFSEIMHLTSRIFSAEMTNNDKQLSQILDQKIKILTLTENLRNFLDGDVADLKLCLQYHVLNPSKIQDFLSLEDMKNDAKSNRKLHSNFHTTNFKRFPPLYNPLISKLLQKLQDLNKFECHFRLNLAPKWKAGFFLAFTNFHVTPPRARLHQHHAGAWFSLLKVS